MMNGIISLTWDEMIKLRRLYIEAKKGDTFSMLCSIVGIGDEILRKTRKHVDIPYNLMNAYAVTGRYEYMDGAIAYLEEKLLEKGDNAHSTRNGWRNFRDIMAVDMIYTCFEGCKSPSSNLVSYFRSCAVERMDGINQLNEEAETDHDHHDSNYTGNLLYIYAVGLCFNEPMLINFANAAFRKHVYFTLGKFPPRVGIGASTVFYYNDFSDKVTRVSMLCVMARFIERMRKLTPLETPCAASAFANNTGNNTSIVNAVNDMLPQYHGAGGLYAGDGCFLENFIYYTPFLGAGDLAAFVTKNMRDHHEIPKTDTYPTVEIFLNSFRRNLLNDTKQ